MAILAGFSTVPRRLRMCREFQSVILMLEIPLLNLRGFLRLFTHIQLLPMLESGEETTLVGGQAVMEGVMMRSPHSYCVAVRKANGEIVTEEKPLARLSERYPIFKLAGDPRSWHAWTRRCGWA